jgi:hypothetical protein
MDVLVNTIDCVVNRERARARDNGQILDDHHGPAQSLLIFGTVDEFQESKCNSDLMPASVSSIQAKSPMPYNQAEGTLSQRYPDASS